jgi:hypothetical protein
MTSRNVEDVYPLSPLQQSLLYRHELDIGDKAYWNQVSVRLAGDLDVDAFRSTWQQIIDRHATLRTRFVHDKSGRPLQAVHTSIELPWHFQDLSGFDEQGQQATVLRRSAAATPPLDRPPLFTLALYRVGPSDHLFVWCYHHIILDGWSDTGCALCGLHRVARQSRPAAGPSLLARLPRRLHTAGAYGSTATAIG